MLNINRHSLHTLYLLVLSISFLPDCYADAEPAIKKNKIDLQTSIVIYRDIKQVRVLDALVEAVNKATVSSQTSGRISKIYFDVNDFAKKGDVLLRMRDKDQQARLKVTQADFNQALTEFNRAQELHTKELIAKSLVDRAESLLKSSAAKLEQAQENLEHTVVRAPYNGIMVKRHIEVGETAQPGTALFTGLSLESLRVAVNLPQDIINQVRLHQSARIELLSSNTKSVTSTSMVISPYADADSHTFLARVNLPEGDHELYPGMAVKVEFIIGTKRILMIPASSISRRSEVTAVYVMSSNQKLSMRQVRVGHTTENNQIEVLAGLSENEQVALDPIRAVRHLKEQQ